MKGPDDAGVLRVLAAHYLRPVARDVHGHVQRLPPAVLATWNPTAGAFDHFAWGVVGELGGRSGRRSVDFEARAGHPGAQHLHPRAGDVNRLRELTPASMPPAPSAG